MAVGNPLACSGAGCRQSAELGNLGWPGLAQLEPERQGEAWVLGLLELVQQPGQRLVRLVLGWNRCSSLGPGPEQQMELLGLGLEPQMSKEPELGPGPQRSRGQQVLELDWKEPGQQSQGQQALELGWKEPGQQMGLVQMELEPALGRLALGPELAWECKGWDLVG